MYRLALFAATALLAADIHDALTPVRPNFSPGREYADDTRLFQGIPGLERAPNGRLWAVWYAGGPDEPTEGPGTTSSSSRVRTMVKRGLDRAW
jgi:hypothetical protein